MKSATKLAIFAIAIKVGCVLASKHGAIFQPEERRTIQRGPKYPADHHNSRRLHPHTTSPTYYPTEESADGTKWPTYYPTRDGTRTSGDDPEYTTSVPVAVPIAVPTSASPVDVPVTTTTTTMATTAAAVTTKVADAEVSVCPNTLGRSLVIDDKATLHYELVPSRPPGSNNGVLCGRLEAQNDDGWIALAISTDGKMIGSEAVIGIPNNGSVLKYNLAGKGQGSVAPMSNDRQTLGGVSIRVNDDDETTIMEFTKLLVEENEIPILEDGTNVFLHARGASSLGFHYNGYLSLPIDFAAEAAPPSEYDAVDFNNVGPFDTESVNNDGPIVADEPVTAGGEGDPVNGIEFKPVPVAKAKAETNNASSNGFIIAATFVPMLMMSFLS